MEELRILAKVDRSALAAYCQSYGRWVEVEKKISETNIIMRTQSGNLVESPLYSISKRERELMHKFLVEFGMTPASRSRLNVHIVINRQPVVKSEQAAKSQEPIRDISRYL